MSTLPEADLYEKTGATFRNPNGVQIMKGWEIKPLGWIALTVVTGIVLYVIVTLRNSNAKEIKANVTYETCINKRAVPISER